MIIAALLLAAATQPFEFQGNHLGVTLSDWRGSHPDAKCGPGEFAAVTQCISSAPAFVKGYGGLSFDFFSPTPDAAPVLYKISLVAAAINEEPIYDGLVGRWGKPATYGVYGDTWRQAGSTLTFMRLSRGVAFNMTLDHVESAYKAAKQKAATAAFE